MSAEYNLSDLNALVERLTFALESAEIGTWDLNILAQTVHWDQRCRQLFGFEGSNEISYTDALDCIHPDDKEMVQIAVAEAIDPHKINDYDLRYRTLSKRDHVLRWVHCKGRAYFNEEGIVYRFAGTARDITQEVTARLKEQQLLSLVNYNADHMSIADMEGGLIYMNEAGRKMLGVPQDADITKMTAKDFYSPEELIRIQNDIIKKIDEKTGLQEIIRLKNCRTGEEIPCQVNYILIKNPVTGEIIGRGATSRDLRPEIKAKTELKRLATIVDISEDFCNYCDLKGNTIYINESGSKLIGVDPLNLAEVNLYNYHSPASSEQLRNTILPELYTSGKWSGILELVHQQSGEVIPIHKQLFIIREEFTNEPVAIAGIARDLRAELNAKRVQKELERQKDNFLAVASHELKTPVTSIKAYAQVLEMMLIRSGDNANASLMSKMDAQINRLTSLIGDLLDVTKINSGHLQFHNEPFDFNQMMLEIIEEIQITSGKHLINSQLAFNRMVSGDRERIAQVVINLLTNAIKYSPDADRIIVYTEDHREEVQLCVQDFGIGLSRDKKDRVFEQFYRVSGTKEHTFPGLGLGLYISSEIIKQLKGRIWVNSVPGKGSTFCFAIPIEQKPDN